MFTEYAFQSSRSSGHFLPFVILNTMNSKLSDVLLSLHFSHTIKWHWTVWDFWISYFWFVRSECLSDCLLLWVVWSFCSLLSCRDCHWLVAPGCVVFGTLCLQCLVSSCSFYLSHLCCDFAPLLYLLTSIKISWQ